MSNSDPTFSRQQLLEEIDSLKCSVETGDTSALLRRTWESTVDQYNRHYRAVLLNELLAAITPEMLAAYLKANPPVKSEGYYAKAYDALGAYAKGIVEGAEHEPQVWSMFTRILKERLVPQE